MAFNLQTFKIRALTAVVFVAVMLSGLLINHWTFFLLFTVIHFGCWVEFQKLIGLIDPAYKTITPFHRYGVMLMGWGFMLWMTNKAYTIGNFDLSEIGWWLLLLSAITVPLTEVLLSKQMNFKLIAHSIFGLLYISLAWGLMISIRNQGMIFKGTFLFMDLGWAIPLTLIASIWINDTMAYIVGSFIGKTPFSKISPKKTWEGTLGGAILAVATVTLVGYFAFGMSDYISLLVISSIAAIAGTAGDLLESKLKRMAGVKDSGQIMPGHGGFLDRFDSLLLATPFVWLYLQFI
ncbi:MAG TPA: phosphatidate cytidylyltransferase [Panacibacter sp.]|nr:phosphatidate cytidylyltransferase [Panacibacter sp.]